MDRSEAGELAQRNRELSILNHIAEALNRTIDLDGALRAALAQAADLLGLQTGWVWLLEEGSEAHYLAAAQNLPPGLARNPDLMEGSCYCLDTYRAGDLGGAANISVITCSRLKKLVAGTGGLRFHASIPLSAHGKNLGVLNLASGDWRELTKEDLTLLSTVGDLLSIAIERARLYARSAEYGAAEERSRLAREIHDTLAQGLAGITLQLETADAILEGGANAEQVRSLLSNALALARSNLEEARRSVLDLRAAPLEGRSLSEALAELAAAYTARGGLKVAFSQAGAGRQLPLRIEVGLYRIAQEALANAERHANASSARLNLVFLAGQIQLTISDDGQGFDPDQVPPGHFGLVGLNERARLLAGSLRIGSQPGKGTKIEIAVPIPA
jgi:two-component system NarL family sensor kinase